MLYTRRDSLRPVDPNGFLFNPTWLGSKTYPYIQDECRFRVATGHLEERSLFLTDHKKDKGPCLSGDERKLVTLNEAASTLGIGFVCASNSQVGSVRGHVNWFPITATGQLRWEGYSKGIGADNDITFQILPSGPAVLTAGNLHSKDLTSFTKRPGYHLEFYSTESVDRYTHQAWMPHTWWDLLRDRLTSDSAMQELLDGRFAIVTGLYGLDGVHGFHAELHPVYAMSVLVDTLRVPGGFREQWALMVRNLGNEGDCSEGSIPMFTGDQDRHLEEQDFVIDLGGWPNARVDSVRLGPSWSTSPLQLPTMLQRSGEHLYLNFHHPRPEPGRADYLLLGTVFVYWTTTDNWNHSTRLGSWLPSSDRALNLSSSKADSIAGKAGAEPKSAGEALREKRERLGIENPDTLKPMALRLLRMMDAGWKPESTVRRPDPAIPWHLRKQIPHQCRREDLPGSGGPEPEGSVPLFDQPPFCRNGWRWVFTPLAVGIHGGYSPAFAIYTSPHGAPGFESLSERSGVPGFVGKVLSAPGWRLELKASHFRRRREIVPGGHERHSGGTLLLSPIIAPVGFRVSPTYVITPYTVISGGVSALEHASTKGVIGTGLGLHGAADRHSWVPEIFFEYLHLARAGAFDSQSLISIGIATWWPFLR